MSRDVTTRPAAAFVERSRQIAAEPAAVFAALTDLGNLNRLLPRLRQMAVVEEREAWAKITARMLFGPLRSFPVTGEVTWRRDLIIFRTDRPARVETRWSLTPSRVGTLLRVDLTLDLAPMVGPLAALIPRAGLAAVIAGELDATLAALAGIVEPE